MNNIDFFIYPLYAFSIGGLELYRGKIRNTQALI